MHYKREDFIRISLVGVRAEALLNVVGMKAELRRLK
jgi:hypothetical protein